MSHVMPGPLADDPCHCTMQGAGVSERGPPAGLYPKHFSGAHRLILTHNKPMTQAHCHPILQTGV